jgi:4-diphosphocytidyl-2-C-methyl-D-erythritol kinase
VSVALRLDAPGKLNLSLRVVGRRNDGLHLLESEMVLLDLADRLLLMPGCSGLRVEGAADGVPPGQDNLAWRGLVAGLGAEPDVACLTLEKRLPSAAGLGGGSSDAAAAWRLGRAWRGERAAPDAEQLAELAAIGADVPFFAAEVAAARVTGIGEAVQPAPATRQHVVLVHPPFTLSTADVFSDLRPDEWGRLENDLLAPAGRVAPALGDLFELVVAAGGTPRLTGTGPTIFSMHDDPDQAAAVAAAVQARGVRATITATRTSATEIERADEEEL